ncbi:MAG: MFS transporter [Nitrososphaerota archaeon]
MRVEEVLDLEALTPLQARILWIARLSWAFVAMEIILISFTLPLFISLFSLDSLSAGLLASAVLIGDIVGAIALGRLTDVVGRRAIFQLSLLWYALFTALTALAANFPVLLLLRILAGVGLGGMLVVDPTLLSEFLPKRKRGGLMVSLDLFWPLGSLLALGLAYAFLQLMGGNWRGLFLAAAFPAFTVALFRLYVPESPFYLAKRGRLEQAALVLRRLTGSAVEPNAISFAVEEKGSYQELFTSYARRALAMLFAWAALNYTYYGLFLWLPQILNVVNLYGNVWLFLVLAFIFQVPGYVSAMYLVERWGRKATLVSYLLLSGLTGILMALAVNDLLAFTAALLLVSFFNLGAWGSVYPFTSELFPTKLRGKAFGLAEGVGKVVAVLGPVIFGAIFQAFSSVTPPLLVTMGIAVVGALAVALLAPETKRLLFD